MAYDFRHRLHFYKNGTEYTTGLCTAKSDVNGISSFIIGYLGMCLGQTIYYLGLGTFGSSDPLPLRVKHPTYTGGNLRLIRTSLSIDVQVIIRRGSSVQYDVEVYVSCSYTRTEDLTIRVAFQASSFSSPTRTYSDTFSALDTSEEWEWDNQILNGGYIKVSVEGFGSQVWFNGTSVSLPSTNRSTSRTVTVKLM